MNATSAASIARIFAIALASITAACATSATPGPAARSGPGAAPATTASGAPGARPDDPDAADRVVANRIIDRLLELRSSMNLLGLDRDRHVRVAPNMLHIALRYERDVRRWVRSPRCPTAGQGDPIKCGSVPEWRSRWGVSMSVYVYKGPRNSPFMLPVYHIGNLRVEVHVQAADAWTERKLRERIRDILVAEGGVEKL